MTTQELEKYAKDALERVPEEHRRRGVAAGVGAAIGGMVGSVLGGLVGAAIGASVGGVTGVAIDEKSQSERRR